MIKKQISITLIFFGILSSTIMSPVYADWKLLLNGNLQYSESEVLGEEVESSSEETQKLNLGTQMKEFNQKAKEYSKEMQQKIQEQRRELIEREQEMKRNQQELKREQQELKKIHKNLIQKRDIKRIELRPRSKDKIQVGIEETNGDYTSEEQRDFKVETESDPLDITSSNKGEIKIVDGIENAVTSFPITVDPETKKIEVETPEGIKEANILPTRAKDIVTQELTVDAQENPKNVELKSEDGKLVYKMQGEKYKKFFGFFPVSIQKEITVSAENGQIVKTTTAPWSTFLNFFSF